MEMDILFVDYLTQSTIKVTPCTLFKKKEYQGLSEEKKWKKAFNDGWKYARHLNKFYR